MMNRKQYLLILQLMDSKDKLTYFLRNCQEKRKLYWRMWDRKNNDEDETKRNRSRVEQNEYGERDVMMEWSAQAHIKAREGEQIEKKRTGGRKERLAWELRRERGATYGVQSLTWGSVGRSFYDSSTIAHHMTSHDTVGESWIASFQRIRVYKKFDIYS